MDLCVSFIYNLMSLPSGQRLSYVTVILLRLFMAILNPSSLPPFFFLSIVISDSRKQKIVRDNLSATYNVIIDNCILMTI